MRLGTIILICFLLSGCYIPREHTTLDGKVVGTFSREAWVDGFNRMDKYLITSQRGEYCEQQPRPTCNDNDDKDGVLN